MYCTLIARRAVARAALHLGVTDLTAEALHVLSDVLLEFLGRLGRTISHTVEASGRSSAHANVLDALRAVELCTTTAVTQVHHRPSDDHPVTTSDTSWKGLAAFLFGPDWMQEEQREERSEGGGGKVRPRAASRAGWYAPYPEEIPYFPVVANPALIANPHSLLQEELQTIVIEKPVMMNETSDTTVPVSDDLPETLFQTWGSLLPQDDDNQKRKRDKESEEPVSKKVKLTDNTIQEPETVEQSLYLPSYYPPLPRAAQPARTVVVEAPSAARDSSASSANVPSIRSSLVQLEDQEWGSLQEDGPTVTVGFEDVPVQPQIVPLGRASGSRVSRILEGSMELGA
ncbi:hypothetical protein FisN_11Hh286 [Fistulifera solaris]|uniref:Bromodomain associated domain-containing protein n=1 Tax=Fistulifera solaris TaxID=1519565 RepID=A0A1Z5JLK9_FISSO|nr:hypothetical protein FisN_11Hh286 [Fistulifera solaris]|eukprot:GAX14742.1 hypothetical protein FisN_11Hh286 [Fistulifera solaris]